MAKYILQKIKDPDNKFDIADIVHTIETESLDELLEAIADYLRACSFSVDGNLEIVKED